MLDDLFITVLNTSITASWLILAIFLIRPLIKKAPKWIGPALWALVAVRLICPFSIESAFSLVPSGETIPLDITMEQNPQIDTGISSINAVFNPVIAEVFTPNPIMSANPLQLLSFILANVWAIGMVLMILYALFSYIKLKLSVRVSVAIGKNVLACDEVKSPFILGIFKPMIYVPSSMDGDTLKYVLSHENAHIKRRDYLWKPLGYLILTVYWFNPLCWVAYILLCKDIELACDEKVIRDMDDSGKAAYSQALLDCSFSRKAIAACPVAFGEVDVKTRVKSVLNYKKPAFWIVVVSLVLIVVLAICFMTNPKASNKVDEDEFTYLIGEENFKTEEAKEEAYRQYLAATVEKNFNELSEIKTAKAVVESSDSGEKYNIKLALESDDDLSTDVIKEYGNYLEKSYNNIEISVNGAVQFSSTNYTPVEKGESDEKYSPITEITKNEYMTRYVRELPETKVFNDPVNTLQGIVMTINKYTASGGEIALSSMLEYDVSVSPWFDIQVKKNDKWYPVDRKGDFAQEDYLYLIQPDKTIVIDNDWSGMYGDLPAGYYRIVMLAHDPRMENGKYIDSTKHYIATEFEVL